jgi:hypothetical protein
MSIWNEIGQWTIRRVERRKKQQENDTDRKKEKDNGDDKDNWTPE